MRDPGRLTILAGLLLLGTGCGGTGSEAPRLPDRDAVLAAVDAGDHEEAFRLLEEGLLTMPGLRMSFTAESSGAFTASLAGFLDIRADADTLVRAEGSFGGQAMDLLIVTEGDSLISRSGVRQTAVAMPPHVREALVIGLTRMGILHNLARLTVARPPDHADGGVREWVEVVDVRAPSGDAEGEGSGSRSFRFGLRVSGQDSGDAVLMVNGTSGLPRIRMQEVRFPGGMMTVREEYAWRP